MITASKLRKLKKDKKKLFNTVRIAAENLVESKLEQGRKESKLAMLAALQKEFHFGQSRLNRVLATMEPTMRLFDLAPEQVDQMERYWRQQGVKV